MSFCSTCAKPFGFFNRESGCPLCKVLTCKKCLVKVKDVRCCLRCSKMPSKEELEKNKKSVVDVENLLRLNKEEEAFEPVLEPFSYTNESSSNDDAIVDDIRSRLKVLKSEPVPGESSKSGDDEIAARLANLKGVSELSSNKIQLVNDTRSDQEKIADLLEKVVAEANIDAQMKPEDEDDEITKIEKRLAALRGIEYKKVKHDEFMELPEKTEDEECSDVMKKYLDEAKLEVIAGDPDEEELMSTIPKAPGDKNLDELPFCELCNEDATLRCMECENLFCLRCFKEFHDEEDYKNHPTKPYQAPKNQS